MTNRNNQGVEVILDCLKDSNTPRCPHGPTILFERYGNKNKRFYACSACRDRKGCNFFQHEDAVVSESSKLAREKRNKTQGPKYTHEDFLERLSIVRKQGSSNRKFCHTCHLLLLPTEWNEHKTHLIRENIQDDDLNKPTSFLCPLENNKSNAQFLFSDGTNNFLLDCIRNMGFKRVLCIGTPRLYEALTAQTTGFEIKTLLLDIDHRYMQFLEKDKFCYYNMFNHHFFDIDGSSDVFEEFISKKNSDILIAIDPPFGGLVEILAHTLQTITKARGSEEGIPVSAILPTMLFFPYYMENKVTEYLPSFQMSDYRVNYNNHDSYQTGPKGRKYGSPVRIFTNIALAKMRIPRDLGYRWCDMCQMSVYDTNIHCDKCKSCTSKDGSQYKHCDICQRCVKPSRIHCNNCQLCVLQDHNCGQLLPTGCHICGEDGHKRRECPKRHEIWSKSKVEKRKSQLGNSLPQKKSRKEHRRKKKYNIS